MVRTFLRDSNIQKGELIVQELNQNRVEVFYVPSEDKLTQSGLEPAKANDYQVKLLDVTLFPVGRWHHDTLITVYPTNTLGGHPEFLQPKYQQIKRIKLANFFYLNLASKDSDGVLSLLQDLPSGFIKDYDYGLGFLKEYRFIVDAVEDLSDCTEIIINSHAVSTGISQDDSTVFVISYQDFENARKLMNRIADRAGNAARSLKRNAVFNLLADRIGEKEKPIQLGRHPVTRLVTQAAQSDAYLEEADQEAVLNVLSKNTRVIAETKPDKLVKLQNDIELVTLEVLIERYGTMLQKRLREDRWQEFFNENPFILSLAFGYPVIKVKDQASIGGRKLSGSGEKITDFLVKNSLTNNTALFEIKTPQAGLLNKTAYREGVFTPSPDLSGSINQALDQKYQFQKQIAQIKEASRVYDIESYAVHCCLIIGVTPTDSDRQKSFELFRRNSKDVQIVTFDELLEKLRQLHSFLITE